MSNNLDSLATNPVRFIAMFQTHGKLFLDQSSLLFQWRSHPSISPRADTRVSGMVSDRMILQFFEQLLKKDSHRHINILFIHSSSYTYTDTRRDVHLTRDNAKVISKGPLWHQLWHNLHGELRTVTQWWRRISWSTQRWPNSTPATSCGNAQECALTINSFSVHPGLNRIRPIQPNPTHLAVIWNYCPFHWLHTGWCSPLQNDDW